MVKIIRAPNLENKSNARGDRCFLIIGYGYNGIRVMAVRAGKAMLEVLILEETHPAITLKFKNCTVAVSS